MPRPRSGRIDWSGGGRLVVVPAVRSLGSVVAGAAAKDARWVVVRRAVEWQAAPLWYAYLLRELQDLAAQRPERATLPVEEALELRETRQSAPSTGAARPEQAPLSEEVSPSASRVVHLDAEGRPVAVGQVTAEAPLGRLRGGGGRARAQPSPAAPPPPSAEAPVRRNGGAAPAPAPASERLDAILSAQAPSEVQVGREALVDVKVEVQGTAAPLAHAIIASLSAGETIVAILTLHGDALEALDPRHVRLEVPRPDRPSTTAFQVRAVREGVARVAVIFRQGGSELGTVEFPLRVVPSAADARPATHTATAAPRNAADDGVVLLLVDEERAGGEQRYRYRLVAAAPLGWDFTEFFSDPLKDRGAGAAATPRAYVQSIYDRLGTAFATGRSLDRELRALGTDLSRQLFPKDLLRLLWDHRDDLRTVHVKSWEPFIPWELARLRHPDTAETDARFLAEYDLVRSLNGKSRPHQLRLGTWRYLAATYPNGLEAPLDGDVAVFTDTLEARHVSATALAPDPDAILDALAQPDFDVLHVCCHGQAQHDDIERSALIVGDRLGPGGAPEPVLLDALTVREEARLGDRGPLVFLNACESGRMGASLTAWGGWPKTFWDAGAAAFVGTSWPVEDSAARAFCEAFYGGLLDGHTLAEAAGSGRRAARRLHEPTSLAYKVYGYPGARRG